MGRGQWGEGFTGTTIKDTWTKSRGRVEEGEGGGFGWGGVEGWGENADNCNRITIKNNLLYFIAILFLAYYIDIPQFIIFSYFNSLTSFLFSNYC